METGGEPVGHGVLKFDGFIEIARAHQPEHGAETFREVQPRAGLYAEADAGRPKARIAGVATWFEQPRFAGIERGERAMKIGAGLAQDRRDDTRGIRGGTDAQARGGVAELAAKNRIVIDLGFEDAEARGGTFLPGVTEGGTHEIPDRQIAIGECADDDRIFPARLGVEPQRGTPILKHARRFVGTGEDDGGGARIGDELPASLAVCAHDELQHVAGHSRLPKLLHEPPCGADGVARGFQDHAVPRHQRSEHAAAWDGEGKIPRRRDDDDTERARLHAHRCRAGRRIVAGKINGLGDFGIRLADGLLPVVAQHRDRFHAVRGHPIATPPENRSARGIAEREPRGLRCLCGGERGGDGGGIEFRGWGGKPESFDRAGNVRAVLGLRPIGVGGVFKNAVRWARQGCASRFGTHGSAFLPSAEEARLLLLPCLAAGPECEDGAEEIFRRGVLIEPADEIGERAAKILLMNERRIDQQRASLVAHRAGLVIGHPFEHLDLDGVAHAVRLAQDERERHVEEIVRADTHAHRGGIFRLTRVFEHPAKVRVRFRLGRIRRRVPAVQLGLDIFHREVRAFHQPDLDLRAARRHALLRPVGEFALRDRRIRQVGLECDSRAQRQELRLAQHCAKCGDREREVAVFLHVEIHEFPRGQCGFVQHTQPQFDFGKCGVPCGQIDLAEDGRHFHRDVINVRPREQCQHGIEAPRGLLFAENGLAEQIHIHAHAVAAPLGEKLRERRGLGRKDDAAAVVPKPPLHRSHDDRRHKERGHRARTQHRAVEPSEAQRHAETGEHRAPSFRRTRCIAAADDAIRHCHAQRLRRRSRNEAADLPRARRLRGTLLGERRPEQLLRESHGFPGHIIRRKDGAIVLHGCIIAECSAAGMQEFKIQSAHHRSF